MPLFKTISEIAQFVTISYANTTSAMPKQTLAEEQFIKPVLGDTLFASLQAEVDASPGVAITHTALLDKVRMALGFLIFYKELPLMHTLITDSGLKNVTNDKIQGAYRYQYEIVMQHLENEGMAALERLYEYLMANAGSYATWTSSTAYTRLNKNLIRTGKDFSSLYYLFQPNRTFFALQPVMTEVEDLFIKSSIGETYLYYLRDLASPSAQETIVINFLKKSIANFTIYKAITKLAVKVRPEGFTVMIGGTDRSPQGEQNATAQQLETLMQDCYKDGNSYLERAKLYLNTYASTILFPTYFSSTYYTDLAVEVESINDNMDGMYAF